MQTAGDLHRQAGPATGPICFGTKRSDDVICNVLVAVTERSSVGFFSRLFVPRSVRRAMHPRPEGVPQDGPGAELDEVELRRVVRSIA